MLYKAMLFSIFQFWAVKNGESSIPIHGVVLGLPTTSYHSEMILSLITGKTRECF